MSEKRVWMLNTDADAVEYLARVMCAIVGIYPIDPLDGGSNWWIFNEDATKIVNDLRKRFPLRGSESDMGD